MTTPKVSAPELAVSQASKEVTANEAFRRLEAGASFYLVEDNDATAPPGSCADGAQYIPAATATGAWAGHEGDIAIAVGTNAANGWYFREPEDGVFAWIKDEDVLHRYNGNSTPGSWTAYTASAGSTALDDLTDVDTAGFATGEVLTYDGGSPAGWYSRPLPVEIGLACSDETTALTTGAAKITFRMPHAMTLTAVRASVTTAPTGSTLIVDINEGGSTLLSTKLSIDASEKTSTTAASAAVISDSALADDAEITIDIDQVGSTIAGAGLKVWLIGTR
jgi:hypothetical protein